MNYIVQTKNWINDFVVQLNLCPFAQHPYKNDRIRYVVYEGRDLEEFIEVLRDELLYIQKTPAKAVETTLLIHPNLLLDFLDYNDFLDVANHLIFALQLDGLVQIASFHPAYQFAGTRVEEVTNYTNRSPFPMLHLLREESIEKAIEQYGSTEQIPANNMKTLRQLGLKKTKKILDDSKRKDRLTE